MIAITPDLMKKVIKENDKLNNEYEFQFALAMGIKENFPEVKVKIEQNVYCDLDDEENSACRCDIVCYNEQKEAILLAELKYVVVGDVQSSKTSCSARSSFVSDINRLQQLKKYPNAKKYCIFATNKTAVYNNNAKAKGSTNYFNEKFANPDIWQECENEQYNPAVRFLIVDVTECENIPVEYCY